MQNFLSNLRSSLNIGQQKVLQKFLDDASNNRVTANVDSINTALNTVGDLLPLPNADLTDPDGYNTTLATIQANIAGLMQEVDLLEATQSAMEDLGAAALDNAQIALQELQTILDGVRAANSANSQYTDIFFETFGVHVNRETDPSWYKPIPQLASSGQVNSYLPLFIDPDDRTLKLFPGGDFSRTTNAKGDRLAHVEIEEMLGISSDPNHPITQAVDGNFFTYWGETILSDQPIDADPLQVPWLPDAYSGGTAARIHFRFPFSIPFTEVVIRPFSKFPIHALQVVWDNRKVAVSNFLQDPFFSSGTTYWTTGGTTANQISFFGVGGVDNLPYIHVQSTSGRTTLQSNTFVVSGSEFAYHLVFKINKQFSIKPRVLVEWFDLTNTLVRADWHLPDTPNSEWFEAGKLFNAPSGITSGWTGTVTFVIDGSGSCSITSASFSKTAGAIQLDQQQSLDSDSIIVQLDKAGGVSAFGGTDLWLVVSQPHYEFLQLTVPLGDLDKQDVWNDIRLQVDAATANAISTNTTLFSYQRGLKTTAPVPLVEDGTALIREVNRLGGKIRDIAVSLQRLATPNQSPIVINKYMYILGAWEIQIRHREYAPQGLFVSNPYKPRGEVRQLLMITDPPISTLSDRVRFWITARADDRVDKAKEFKGRATFSSSTESVTKRADTHFTLTPVTIREVFSGTDRQHRIILNNHPYVDRDRIWTIQSRLTSGFTSTPVAYDPNKDPVYFLVGGNVASIPGYRPMRVTLQFANGTIARPDLLGKIQTGDISLQTAEILSSATISQEFSLLTQGTQKDIESKVAAAQPSDREEIRARLVQQALTDQQLGGGQNTSKRTQTIQLTALQTKFKRIVSGINGANFSLYWHKSTDDQPQPVPSGIITTNDVLISPAKYSVDAQNGVIVVRDSPPSGNKQYDSFVAYYYYQQDEIGARVARDSRDVTTRPTSGVDFAGSLPQTFLVTRNVTDYIRGNVSQMRQPNTDDLDPDFYPVYEYLVDDRGRLIFAADLSQFGDNPTTITVEYESLLISPRVIIEYTQGQINEFSTSTPILNAYSLNMQSRK